MNFADYLSLIRRRLPLVGTVVGIVSLISVGMSMRQEPLYQSAARLRARQIAPLSAVNPFLEQQGGLGADLSTEAHVIASDKVASIVMEKLGLPGPSGTLIKSLEVFAVEGTAIIAIRSRASTPQLAMDLANGFADAYLEVRRREAGEVIDRAIEKAKAGLGESQERLLEADRRRVAAPPGSVGAAEAEAERSLALADLVGARSLLRDLADHAAVESGSGEIIQPADEASLIRNTSPTRSLVFGALLGVPLALAIVLLLESLSETVRSANDAEAISGVEVLGLIPFDERVAAYGAAYAAMASGKYYSTRGPLGRLRYGKNRDQVRPALAVDADPFSLASEAYRTASLNVETAARENGCHTILVTSALAGEGKTTTLCNLAASTAERAQDVLLVDADLRRPSAHAYVEGDAEPGLAEVLDATVTPKDSVQKPRPHLAFVASGAPVERPDQVLTRVNLGQVLGKLVSALPGSRSGNGTASGKRDGASAAQVTVFVDSAPILQAAESLALARAVDGIVLVIRAGITRRQAAARAVEQIHRAGVRLLGVLLVGVSSEVHLGLTGPNPLDTHRTLALVRDEAQASTRG